MIAHGERGVKAGLGPGRCGQEADRSGEIAGNPTGLSIGGRERTKTKFFLTKKVYERLREDYYRRRHEEWLKQSMAEELAKLGLSEEMLQQREQELVRTTGVSPKKSAVVLSLFNETILKLKDLNEMEERYHNLAIILNKGGEESFHILKAAAKTKLAALKKEGFKNVSILTSQMCEACKQVDGKVLSIEEALRTMPIPIKKCTNYPYNESHSFCICSYEPE